GDDHLALTVGVGADAFGLRGTQRAQLVGDALALGLHATIDRLRDLVGQVDPLQAHIDDLHADGAGVAVRALAHLLHDAVTLAGDDVVHGTAAELLTQTGVDRLREAGARTRLVAGHRLVVEARVDDAPLDE